MLAFRKLLYKPRKNDSSLLAEFYHLDEEVIAITEELDGFREASEPNRCVQLVAKLKATQVRLLNVFDRLLKLCLKPIERQNYDFRFKYPDDVDVEQVRGHLWLAAECTVTGVHTQLMRADENVLLSANSFLSSIETLRKNAREFVLSGQYYRMVDSLSSTHPLFKPFAERIPVHLKNALINYEKNLSNFEFLHVSRMTSVRKASDIEYLWTVAAFFSETAQLCIRQKLFTFDDIETCDPAFMVALPRIAIVVGLIIYPESVLNPRAVLARLKSKTSSRTSSGAATSSSSSSSSVSRRAIAVNSGGDVGTGDALPAAGNVGGSQRSRAEKKSRKRFFFREFEKVLNKIRDLLKMLSKEELDLLQQMLAQRIEVPASLNTCENIQRTMEQLPAVGTADIGPQSTSRARAAARRSTTRLVDLYAPTPLSPTSRLPPGAIEPTLGDLARRTASSKSSVNTIVENTESDVPPATLPTGSSENQANTERAVPESDHQHGPILNILDTDVLVVTCFNDISVWPQPDVNSIPGRVDSVGVNESHELAVIDEKTNVDAVSSSQENVRQENVRQENDTSINEHSDNVLVEEALPCDTTNSKKAQEPNETDGLASLDSVDLSILHRSYVCICGVADQWQSAYAADLRFVMKVALQMFLGRDSAAEETVEAETEAAQFNQFLLGADRDGAETDGAPSTTPAEPTDEARSEPMSARRSSIRNQLLSLIGQSRASRNHPPTPPQSDAGPLWVEDSQAQQCFWCNASFTFLRRRHHCRSCGHIFCSDCCSVFATLPDAGFLSPTRLCLNCYSLRQSRLGHSDRLAAVVADRQWDSSSGDGPSI